MKNLLTLLAALSLFLAWFFWEEVPSFRGDGAVSVPLETVATVAATNLCPRDGERLELRGDSHVVGARMGRDNKTENPPYGRIMQRRLGARVSVIIRGRGGFTAEMAEQEWKDVDPKGDIVLLALGTNDAAPRGWFTRKDPVPLKTFKASMIRQITRESERGAIVALVAPPPGGTVAINRRLKPYREAVRSVGISQGIAVIDPSDALSACWGSEPLLTRDALHLNAAGHHCLGNFMATAICPQN